MRVIEQEVGVVGLFSIRYFTKPTQHRRLRRIQGADRRIGAFSRHGNYSAPKGDGGPAGVLTQSAG